MIGVVARLRNLADDAPVGSGLDFPGHLPYDPLIDPVTLLVLRAPERRNPGPVGSGPVPGTAALRR